MKTFSKQVKISCGVASELMIFYKKSSQYFHSKRFSSRKAFHSLNRTTFFEEFLSFTLQYLIQLWFQIIACYLSAYSTFVQSNLHYVYNKLHVMFKWLVFYAVRSVCRYSHSPNADSVAWKWQKLPNSFLATLRSQRSTDYNIWARNRWQGLRSIVEFKSFCIQ